MSSQNYTGYAFNFKLPSEGLALRSVTIENDTPKLIFDAALNTPTLTEEDVGTACRLACEGVRPEFFYVAIPNHHPYFGRQYKHYSPQWLRGTSIGELLSEADWTMKCLNIGARSDETKEKFWAWQETSQLEGLATRCDFPIDKSHGSIIMSCDSVRVQKTEREMVFLEEPKMKITADSSTSYSKYITDIYSSIAFYDEPLFLKMQELMKLIVAIEWLVIEKKVRFSHPWMMECSAPQSQKSSKSIEVKMKGLGEAEIRDILRKIVKQLPETSHKEVMTPSLGAFIVDTVVEKTFAENGFEVKCTKTVVPSLLSSPEIKQTTTIRASVNDYNMLYNGMDPNMPIIPEMPGLHDEKITPNVGSWSELFAETVPWPGVWKKPPEMDVILSATGGVTTKNINPVINEQETVAAHSQSEIRVPSRAAERTKAPVRRESECQGPYVTESNGSLGIQAQRGKREKAERVPHNMVPLLSKVNRPDSVVTSKTRQTVRNRAVKCDEVVGWEDKGGGQRQAYTPKGDIKLEQQSMRSSIHHRTEVNGQVVQEARYGAAMAPATTTTQTSKIEQESREVKCTTKRKKRTTAGRRGVKSSSTANITPPVQPQTPPISVSRGPEQQQQLEVHPPQETSYISPTASVASPQDSRVVNPLDEQQSRLHVHVQERESRKRVPTKHNSASARPVRPSVLPQELQRQIVPVGVTSPDGSAISIDSGFSDGQESVHPPAHLNVPHISFPVGKQQQQQTAQPAPMTDPSSPSTCSSVASKDSGFSSVLDSQQSDLNEEGERNISESAKHKDSTSDTLSDSGNGSPDEFDEDRMDND